MKDKIDFFVVICIQTKELIYCDNDKQSCLDHINNAIDINVDGAKYWVIRPAVTNN